MLFTTQKSTKILFLSLITAGCSFFIAWAALYRCNLDVMVWNVVFLLVNFMHFFFLLYKRRPVSSAQKSLITHMFGPEPDGFPSWLPIWAIQRIMLVSV